MPQSIAMGRFRGLDLTIVKPLTFMNESGLAVRKVLAREHAPLGDLLVIADDFALPFGKLRFREKRRRRAATTACARSSTSSGPRSSAGSASGSARRTAALSTTSSPRSSRTSASASMGCSRRPPTRSRSGPAHGTSKAANRFNMFELRPADEARLAAPGAVDGPPDEDGRPPDEDRLAEGPPARGAPSDRRSRTLRGKRGRDRRLAAVARPGRRAAPPAQRRRASRISNAAAGRCSAATQVVRPICPRCAPAPGREPARSATLRERLRPSTPAGPGRHVGLNVGPPRRQDLPRGDPRPGRRRQRLAWIARDAEIGDRVAEELAAWLGDPATVVGAGAPDVARLRAERARRRRDGGPRRGPVRVAERPGPGPRGQRPGPAPAHDRARAICRPSRAACGSAAGSAPRPSCTSCSAWATRPAAEVAGRGEFARRGGIVDVFPPSAAPAGPNRVLRRRDRFAARLRPDRPAHRRAGSMRSSCCPRRSSSRRTRAWPRSAPASAAGCQAPRAPGGGPRAVRGRAGSSGSPARPTAPPSPVARRRAAEATTRALARRRRGRGLGRPSRPVHRASTTSTAGTLLVLDEPGDIAEAAEFLWRQADERRAELVRGRRAAEGLAARPTSAPRDWKRRLVAGADARAHLGIGDAGRAAHRRPRPAARATRSAGASRSSRRAGPRRSPRRSERWRADGARIVLASDQAPRLAELLEEAGHPVGGRRTRPEAPPPGAITLVERSLNGGFAGGPDGLVFVTDRELFGSVRVRRPKAMRRVVPRDILERLTPGDLVVHIDHGVARYERMLRRGNRRTARSATTSS